MDRKLSGLTGERALLTAVLATAVKDLDARAAEHRASAWKYFLGPEYRLHLNLLGFPETWVPEQVKEMANGCLPTFGLHDDVR